MSSQSAPIPSPVISNGTYFIRSSRRSTEYVYLHCQPDASATSADDEKGSIETARKNDNDGMKAIEVRFIISPFIHRFLNLSA